MERQCLSPQKHGKIINPRAEIAESTSPSIQIKLGFTDHPLPKSTDPHIYPGTDTRNDYTNWNVSTEISKLEIRANLYKT